MIIKTLVVTDFATNCYVLGCARTHEGAIIDPGGNAPAILAVVEELGLAIKYVINTHGHMDHTSANQAVLEGTGALLVAHKLEAPLLTDPVRNLSFLMGHSVSAPAPNLLVEDGHALDMGAMRWQVLHTPGHTPGGLSLYSVEQGIVFSGDTLFRAGVGRTDLPGGDYDILLRSIADKLFTLPDETVVYPGHGPTTTIGHEKVHNPWLRV